MAKTSKTNKTAKKLKDRCARLRRELRERDERLHNVNMLCSIAPNHAKPLDDQEYQEVIDRLESAGCGDVLERLTATHFDRYTRLPHLAATNPLGLAMLIMRDQQWQAIKAGSDQAA